MANSPAPVVAFALIGLMTCSPPSAFRLAETRMILEQAGPLMPVIPAGLVRSNVIRPFDVVAIRVTEDPELTGEYAVSEENGTVWLPVIGALAVEGLSPEQAAARVATVLANGHRQRPHVSVTVVRSDYVNVFVLGAVRSPGVVTARGPLSLTAVLAMAGSPTSDAARTIEVARPGDPETLTPTRVGDPDAETIEMDIDRDAWTALRDGDTVYVPTVSTFNIIGLVRNPGVYVLSQGLSVRQAVALAGGTGVDSWDRDISIVRLVDGELREVDADPTTVVVAGDIVRVAKGMY